MITGIKRKNADPDNEAILEASGDPNVQTGLIENPELNYKSILNQDPGIMGKIKLNGFPNFMKKHNMELMGKIKLNTDFVPLANSNEAEIVSIEPPVLKVTDTDTESEDTLAEEKGIEEPTIDDPNDAEIIAEPSNEPLATSCAAEPSDSEPFEAEPTNAEPSPVEPATGAPIPDVPTSNKPTPAKIILPPPFHEPANEPNISDDSDDPDGEDNGRERMNSRRSRIICTFFTFWGVNALICFLAYGSIFYPGTIRAIFETKPNYYPLVLIPREKWSIYDDNMAEARKTYVAKRVTVVQTDTKECDNFKQCHNLLVDLERKEGKLPYNFVISSSGDIFESRGWNEASPLFPEMPTMLVAFIGDYDKKEPSTKQLDQFKALLNTSQHIKHLDSSYKMNGRKIKKLPTKLFDALKGWKQYDNSNSDTEYVSIDLDPQVLDKD